MKRDNLRKDRLPPAPARVPALFRWGAPAAIAILSFLCLLPALHNDFVNWDDESNLVNNPHYRGLSWQHLKWMFGPASFERGHYQPINWLSHGLDYTLWQMNPSGYHLQNLLLHAANTVLFYFLVLVLLRRALAEKRAGNESALRLAAATAALFFSLHPLRVECVAWATARRDVLSTAFFLLTLLGYVRMAAVDSARRRSLWLAASVVCFALSLLTKAAAVLLPLALLVLDVYPLRRREKISRLLLEKVPFFVLSAAAAVLAPLAESEAGAIRSLASHPFPARVLQAFYGLAFYLRRTLFPFDLSPLYELSAKLEPSASVYLLSVLAVLAITVALVLLRRRWPAGLSAWLFYVLMVGPVLGFVQVGPHIAADRYTYLACLPWAVLVGGGAWWTWLRPALRAASGVLAVAVLICFGMLTFCQAEVWRNSITLWRHVIEIYPESYIAQYDLARALFESGRVKTAIPHYERALAERPNDLKILQDTGAAYGTIGQYAPAMVKWRRIIEIDPGHEDALYSLALASLRMGRLDDALNYADRAGHSNDAPTRHRLAALYNDLAAGFQKQGQLSKMSQCLGRAEILGK